MGSMYIWPKIWGKPILFFCKNQSNAVINTIMFSICVDKICFKKIQFHYLELLSWKESKITLWENSEKEDLRAKWKNGENNQNQGNSIFRSYALDMEKTVVNRMRLLGLEQQLLSKRLAINTSSQSAEIESKLHISLFIHI